MGKTERKKELLTAYKERTIVGAVCAIACAPTGKRLVFRCEDPKGRRNRFDFSVSTNTCTNGLLSADWAIHGAAAFTFVVLEELERKPEQTDDDFSADLELLEAMWRARLSLEGVPLY